MATEPQTHPDNWTRFGRTLGRLLGFLLRLLFVLLLAAGLGAGVYFGIPWAYRTVVEPVQTTAVQVEIVANRVDNLRDTFDEGQAAQDERLTELETDGDALREHMAAIETSDAATGELVVDSAAALRALEEEVATLRSENEALSAENESLQAEIGSLRSALAAAEENVASTQTQVRELQTLAATDRSLQRIRIDLFQARLELLAENNGTARDLLERSATDLRALVRSLTAIPADDRNTLNGRIGAAAGLIEDEPQAALAELEGTWEQTERLLYPTEE